MKTSLKESYMTNIILLIYIVMGSVRKIIDIAAVLMQLTQNISFKQFVTAVDSYAVTNPLW